GPGAGSPGGDRRRDDDASAGPLLPPRRLPIGAEVVAGGAHVRVWAPRRRRVEVLRERAGRGGAGEPVALAAEAGAPGYFSGLVPGLGAGDLYRFRLDGEGPYPDPASR